jgi:hypothetical protein
MTIVAASAGVWAPCGDMAWPPAGFHWEWNGIGCISSVGSVDVLGLARVLPVHIFSAEGWPWGSLAG